MGQRGQLWDVTVGQWPVLAGGGLQRRVRGRSRRAASRFSQDMACNGRVWGRNRRTMGRFSQDTASGVGDWGMVVGQRTGSRGALPLMAMFGAVAVGQWDSSRRLHPRR